jgi:hypothetical protein
VLGGVAVALGGGQLGQAHSVDPSHTLVVVALIIALSEAVKADLALIAIFGVLFPALVTGLLVFAAAQSMAERAENVGRRRFRNR